MNTTTLKGEKSQLNATWYYYLLKIKILFTFDSFVDSVNIREVEMQNIVTRQIFGFVFLFSRVQDKQRRERKNLSPSKIKSILNYAILLLFKD